MKRRTRSTFDQPLAPPPDLYDERVATALVSSRRAEPHQIDAFRSADAGGTLAERLIAGGVVTDAELARTMAEHYRVP